DTCAGRITGTTTSLQNDCFQVDDDGAPEAAGAGAEASLALHTAAPTSLGGKVAVAPPRKKMQLARMKDDPITNMAFVASVKRHPVLYDYTLPGHSSREVQDEAWHRVAVECSDTVGNCKERWKNLRASLCRHLRQQQQQAGHGQGLRPKKPYYLAEHMEFVVPFTKTRPASNVSSNSLLDSGFDPMDYMDEVKQEVVDDEPRPATSADGDGSVEDDALVQNSLGSSWADHGDGPAVLQVLDGSLAPPRKRKRDPLESYADEADLNFLKSLLPDMALMSARQKNSFKMAVLTAIEKIVYTAPSDCEAEGRQATPQASQSDTS
ncbi:Transcription factor Adf-1, partial [Frankliniella fusca]